MIRQFLQDLRRRRVPQVAGFYLAASWVLFEVADATFPRLGLPDWSVTLVLVLLLMGFPLVVGLAWLFDITPDGVRRTAAPSREPDAGRGRSRGTDAAPAGGAESGPAARGGSASLFGRIAVTGAIAVLALGGVAFFLVDRAPPAPELAQDRLAVLPFTVRGGEDVTVLAEGMADLLSTKLDGAGGLRSADPNAVIGLTGGGMSAAAAPEIARRLGAGRYVTGSVLEFGGDLRLQAAVYETGRQTEPVAQASVEGEATAFLDLVDDLVARLLVAGDLAPPGRMPRMASLTTESLDALKLFLRGERALRSQRYAEAIPLFERAVETDTAFALAYYRMAVAASWEERLEVRQRAVRQALRYASRLNERDRQLVEAYAATKAGRHAEAEARYRQIVASYPDDIEAWYELAEVVMHRGYFLGQSPLDSRQAFERALALDPGHGSSLFHLSNIAAFAQDLPLLDSLTAVLQRSGSGGRDLTVEAQRAFAAADSAAIEEVLTAMAQPDRPVFVPVFAALATDDPGALRRLDALLVASPGASGIGLHFIHANLAGLGVRDEALRGSERAQRSLGLPPTRAAALAVLPFLRTPAPALDRLRVELERWDPGPVLDELPPWDFARPHRAFQPHLRAYLLGLLANRLGDREEALGWASRLEALGGPQEVRALAGDMARHVRGQVALDTGRPGDALAEVEAASFWHETTWDERPSLVLARTMPILVRAEALHELGRYREAIRWYDAIGVSVEMEGYTHYRRAQAYEALGEAGPAAEHYATFTRLWAEADRELQDRVEHAGSRLVTLLGEA